MSRILITGGAAGLGAALNAALTAQGHTLFVLDRKFGHDVRDPQATYGDPPEELDVLINCAGVNKTGWLEQFEEATWDEVMDINAKGIFRVSKWALRSLALRSVGSSGNNKHSGTILNIVSNASHMPMTCSIAYNASKGAAHIMTLQMARELKKSFDITVFGISPNKLRGTEMSRDIEEQVLRDRGWTREYAQQYQLNALLAGEETDPAELATFVAYLLHSKARHKYLAGCVIPYGC